MENEKRLPDGNNENVDLEGVMRSQEGGEEGSERPKIPVNSEGDDTMGRWVGIDF